MFGTTFFLILGIVLWICLALWPAYIAKNKGHSFILFLLLGIFLSWFISLIAALVVHDRNATPQSIADDRAAEAAIERETHTDQYMEAWADYLKPLNSDQRASLLDFMKHAKSFVPTADEVMSYGVPTLKLNGKYIIAVGAYKQHLGVYPFGSAPIEANAKLLKDYQTSKGTIRVPYDNPLPEKTIVALVQFNLNR